MSHHAGPDDMCGWGGELVDLFRRLRHGRAPDLTTGKPPSMRQIASRAEMSIGHVSEMLRGRARPSPEMAKALVLAMGGTAQDAERAEFYAAQQLRTPRRPAIRPYTLEEYPGPAPLLPDVADGRLGRLLDSRYEIVAFAGRGQELTELVQWRDGQDGQVAAMLVHAPGGQGKTRLAAQFGRLSGTAGWRVVSARHRSDRPSAQAPLPRLRKTAQVGLVAVVDYAERWPLPDLLTLLGDLRSRAATVRVLLLARPSGTWWGSLRELFGEAEITARDLPLGPLAARAADRKALFMEARDRFSAVLGVDGPSPIRPPAQLADSADYRQVLMTHMAALVAVDAHRRGARSSGEPVQLSEYLIDRERDHWQLMYDKLNQPLATPPAVMSRAVFTAALTGAVPYPAGVAALTRASLPNPPQVLDDHAVCYPPPADMVLSPLYPDRLAEDFLATQVPGRRPDTGDAWAATVPISLLVPAVESSPELVRRALTVLVETARRWPHVGRALLHPLLRAHPTLALAAGSAALSRLAVSEHTDIGVLETIEGVFPDGRHVDLDVGIAAVAQRTTAHQLRITTDPTSRASLLAALGDRLSNAGLHTAALTATAEATAIHRHLAPGGPELEARLATSLRDLTVRFTHLGQPDDALQAAEEAVEILRRLAAKPSTLQAELAAALNAHSIALAMHGRPEEALADTEQVVDIHRSRAVDGDPAHLADLALALNNLSVDLSTLQRMPDALVATEESVAIYRQLAGADPARVEPDYAMALTNHAIRLLNVDRPTDAVQPAHEAIAIYRRLAVTNPTTYLADLAWVLSVHTWALMAGWFDPTTLADAIATAHESIDIYQDLPGPLSATFSDDRYAAIQEALRILDRRGHDDEARVIRRRIASLA
jgi:tetratricopeptide (TPR) repeat protein/transcriptional regulator with XRE-family HTH domain